VKLGDSLSGLLVSLLGAAVVWQSRTFPSIPGQTIGPALFPGIVGVGLVLMGLALLVSGRRRPEAVWALDEDMRRPRMAINFGIVLCAVLAYALVVSRLGFFITAALLLAVLLSAFGVGVRRTVVLAAILPFVLHYMFYTLLRVPLPWGLLERIAW
jgi:putative tricarboxylic transport membrane protein